VVLKDIKDAVLVYDQCSLSLSLFLNQITGHITNHQFIASSFMKTISSLIFIVFDGSNKEAHCTPKQKKTQNILNLEGIAQLISMNHKIFRNSTLCDA
jgi:hypothetical protein